jgi:3-phenylpropionate/trans-cinnamate dioxygenase ferredoxin reductase subunit
VDESLRTSDPNIFAAGDVANFPCRALKRRLRFEHEDNARAMGRMAGRNMAGGIDTYRHLPFFYSDLFDISYEAVGEIDSSMVIIEDWVETFRKGVIYYLRNNHVRGVLLWNTWSRLDAARELILSAREYEVNSLVGRLRDNVERTG